MQNLTVVFNVVRMSFQDDEVGGAVQTGTVVAEYIRGQLRTLGPTQTSLEQGLEVPRLADVMLRPRPGTLNILERDQLVIVGPVDHPYINQYWRVEGVEQPQMHPRNRKRFIKMRVSRVDRTRTETLM